MSNGRLNSRQLSSPLEVLGQAGLRSVAPGEGESDDVGRVVGDTVELASIARMAGLEDES